MPTASRSRRRLPRLLLILGGSLAGAVALTQWERSRGGPPWDADAEPYPPGEDLTVTTSDGAQLSVTVAGPADGPTVVLPHCWVGSRAVWGPVARQLVDSGHRVVLYDQRGHGTSTLGDRPLSVPMLGDDLRAVLEATNVRDAVLAGHSMGGMTIQSYAAEHPVDFKERARGVVLVATAATTLVPRMSDKATERAIRRGSNGRSGNGVLGYAVTRSAFGRVPRRADVELTMHWAANTSAAARVGFLAAMSGMDLRPALAGIHVPTAVMVGSRDLLTPPRFARTMASAIPGARLVVLPGVGHMLPLEAPDAVVEAIRSIA